MPEITSTHHAATREEWRTWLEAHYRDRDEIWLISYREGTGVASVAYSDAVEEALCFGWIDSTRKKVDDQRYAQRFSPRRPGSGHSQANKERLARLIRDGRVAADVLAKLDEADIDPAAFEIPADIEAALRSDPRAWQHWQGFSPAYRRIRAAYVDHARDRGPEFDKRLSHLVHETAAGKQFGYGIQGYY